MVSTGVIQKLNLPQAKASLIDLDTGTRYVFPRSEINYPDTVDEYDCVSFVLSRGAVTNVSLRKRYRKEIVFTI